MGADALGNAFLPNAEFKLGVTKYKLPQKKQIIGCRLITVKVRKNACSPW